MRDKAVIACSNRAVFIKHHKFESVISCIEIADAIFASIFDFIHSPVCTFDKEFFAEHIVIQGAHPNTCTDITCFPSSEFYRLGECFPYFSANGKTIKFVGEVIYD